MREAAQAATFLRRYPSESMEALIGLVPFFLWISLIGWSGAYAYHDAKKRGKPPLLVCALVMLLFCPLSLLVWIALRPAIVRPPFNLDDYRVR